MSNTKSTGISGAMTLFLIFLILKLTDLIDWSWWWVTAPLWIGIAAMFVFLFIFLIIAVIAVFSDR